MPESQLDIHDLLEDVEILAISFMELHVRQRSASDVADEDSHQVAVVEEEPVSPVYQLAIDRSSEEDKFRVRLRIEIENRGHIAVEVAVEYEHTKRKSSDFTQLVINEFGRDVGVMAALPYMREAIADLTQRAFGTALLMPIIRRGDLDFETV